MNALSEIGIRDEFINISFSGKKGYHIEIFFNKPVSNDVIKQLYDMVLERIDYEDIKEYGAVELRPLYTNGVKLPLSLNFTNPDNSNNQCLFCDYTNGLQLIKDDDYILKIKKLDTDLLFEILEVQSDRLLYEEVEDIGKQIIETEQAIEQHKPLKIYNKNQDEECTIEAMELLEQRGLTVQGMRHNALFNLCKYYRYWGCTQEENKKTLVEWMQKQDRRTYTTKWQDVLKDIDGIVKYVYDNEISLVVAKKDITVTFDEITKVLKAESKNEKLLLYAMLIHSKRYADKKGVFFMTFSQMAETTGLDERTTRRLIDSLEQQGLITIVQRNIEQSGTYLKKPNKYKVNFINKVENKSEQNNPVFDFNSFEGEYADSLVCCITKFYSDKELKKVMPRRQYEFIRDRSKLIGL